MEESLTYQLLLQADRASGFNLGRAKAYAKAYAEGYAEGFREGVISGTKELLRMLGDKEFVPLDDRVASAIDSINDPQQLRFLCLGVHHAGSWQELLGPFTGGRKGWRGQTARQLKRLRR